ncbi:MAG TPA: hypothetical protein VK993_15905 [Chthoniobacterales bacterium]|nr:hypothetical protein [Chthoniobacterales bacterium]
MKRRFSSGALMALTVLAALLLGSCETTQDRIARRPEAYNALSARDRDLVQRGEIREGMSQDAVYIAWGGPNQRGPGRYRGSSTETWIYFNTTAGDYYPPPFAYGFGGFGYGGFGRFGYGGFGGSFLHRHRSGRFHRHVFYDPFFDPFFYRRTSVVSYPERFVSFQNGRVISFQFLPPPRFF